MPCKITEVEIVGDYHAILYDRAYDSLDVECADPDCTDWRKRAREQADFPLTIPRDVEPTDLRHWMT